MKLEDFHRLLLPKAGTPALVCFQRPGWADLIHLAPGQPNVRVGAKADFLKVAHGWNAEGGGPLRGSSPLRYAPGD